MPYVANLDKLRNLFFLLMSQLIASLKRKAPKTISRLYKTWVNLIGAINGCHCTIV